MDVTTRRTEPETVKTTHALGKRSGREKDSGLEVDDYH
jgi:hypothetical protein